ncbi:DNA-directed RNA polymerase subunit beta [Mycoplasma bradburyae]|uniref:DNA-directed RNA polymerase subunit beta n=1 Tax=Mycoplasma bradburyae TaxID=2963128 RepID=UPI0023414882|nr:DNA-directed RNA polymerase subunit beta [Mycoplasma bradburyae]MDC4184306.1 DNA-directed RNA polymerase subunit beta [Mycoplasma bradburyae]
MKKNSPFHNTEYSPRVVRRNYSKVHNNYTPSNLPGIQVNAYKQFLEKELEEIIGSYFPIKSPNGKYSVEFHGMKILDPERTKEEASAESKTYEASLYVNLSLINHQTGTVKKINKKSSKSNAEGIFFSNIPLMTENGAFIVNGIEKFVVAQIVRSPGAYILNKSQVKLSNSRKRNQEGYICEVFPSKGTLMLFYIAENKDFVQAVVRDVGGESAKVFSITTLLKAFGLSEIKIKEIFKNNDYILRSLESEFYNEKQILNEPDIAQLIRDVETDRIAKVKSLPIDQKWKNLVLDWYKLNQEKQELINSKNPNPAKLESLDTHIGVVLRKLICEKAAKHVIQELSISTRSLDNVSQKEEISYQSILLQHFFQKKRYDLSSAGRHKFVRKLRISERLYQRTIAQDICDLDGNVVIKQGTLMLKEQIDLFKRLSKEKRLNIIREIDFVNPELNTRFTDVNTYEEVEIYINNDLRDETTQIIGIDGSNDSIETLTLADLISIISYIINLPHNIGLYDDIDHLGNKRLKLINELLKSKVQTGMMRIEKYIKDKLQIADGNNKITETDLDGSEIIPEKNNELTVKSVINPKPFQIVIKDFFNTHQLTQFLDQQNPLSELTNKRRISAMGPGGISREDPNLDIRDVHYSHYGRICPIETPEGMNIGLIMSLAFYATIDKNGFLMTPYLKVEDGKITDKVEHLTALREDEYIIAEASSYMDVDKDGLINNDKIIARYRSSQDLYSPKQVDYIDVSPKQVVSVAASLIPFLENDDSSRALMGANMQRQATPLLKPYSPLVGTGVEYKIAQDSGMLVTAKNPGVVTYVDAHKIVVKEDDGKLANYNLLKFIKSNKNTCYNQSPIVSVGDRVSAHQALADGPSMKNGEIALGQNVLVGFTTWSGYNYEDAVIISDRLFKEDVYTSINIDEYVIQCLRTKNGDEEITRDIPNVSESAKRYLDEEGIIMVGADVKEGDILVGKTSPKGQVESSPEEKLIQAILGDKVKQVRESSLKVPNGGDGIVAGIKRFSIANGDELDDDVLELVKVYVVQKRKIQIGDKVAGRHGNKGIISKIVPQEDMPHLEDGTPLDILLNPLGVPSRMNIGQIFELHLGYAARELAKKRLVEACFDTKLADELHKIFGLEKSKTDTLIKILKQHMESVGVSDAKQAQDRVKTIDIDIALKQIGLTYDDLAFKIATPVFEGVNMDDLKAIMSEAGIDPIKTEGKFKLIDGRTGEPFEKPISIGIMYMLKLDHMVDDKIHARAVGPYSKITQQPLGGKSQNGGQRFGEMEVWALQAYGAAHNLREILTIKSDDVRGRNLTYNAIVKGLSIPEPGVPESFKLLTKELQGLGMTLNVLYDDDSIENINNISVVDESIEPKVQEVEFESFTLDDDNDDNF